MVHSPHGSVTLVVSGHSSSQVVVVAAEVKVGLYLWLEVVLLVVDDHSYQVGSAEVVVVVVVVAWSHWSAFHGRQFARAVFTQSDQVESATAAAANARAATVAFIFD